MHRGAPARLIRAAGLAFRVRAPSSSSEHPNRVQPESVPVFHRCTRGWRSRPGIANLTRCADARSSCCFKSNTRIRSVHGSFVSEVTTALTVKTALCPAFASYVERASTELAERSHHKSVSRSAPTSLDAKPDAAEECQTAFVTALAEHPEVESNESFERPDPAVGRSKVKSEVEVRS